MKRSTKVLGKTSSRLLTALSSQNTSVFTISEAQEITKTSLVATRNLLSDLVKKNWLVRLVPGKYLIVPLSAGEKAEFSEDWFVIGKNLVEPAPYYFSHYSALDLLQMTSQPIMTVYVTTPKRHRPVKILGATYRFIYSKPDKLWGIEEIWAKPTEKVKVSDLERTIIDCLANPQLCGGITEISKGLWSKRSEVDLPKLVGYIERYGSKAVAKRLGFLLETFKLGGKQIIKDLQEMIGTSFVLLDPSLPASGKRTSRWGLRININPQELKEIIKT